MVSVSPFAGMLHRALWTGSVFFLGYLACMVFLKVESVGAPTGIMPITSYVSPVVPVVEIREINRGSIVGHITPGTRLVLGGAIVTSEPDGAFSVDAAPFLRNIVDINVPPGARYVGSMKGTKYYPVESKAWLSWKSEPVFFTSEEEAGEAGYEKGK